MGSILAFAEQRDGQIRKPSYETIAEGARLAAALGKELVVGLVGSGVSELAAGLGAHGAPKVYVVDNELLKSYSTEGYADAVAAIVAEAKPDVVLFSASSLGKDLAPRVAARLGAGLASDVTATHTEGGKLEVTRPVYAGKAYARVGFTSPVAVLTLRPNVFPPQKSEGRSAEVVSVAAPLSAARIRARVKETLVSDGGTVELTEAEVVVSGGRGIQGPENFKLIEELAASLGAAAGASRAIVDAGWVDHHHQVGQTGKTVSPNLYVAVGISGAIQHLAGMSSSKVIVAVNKDPEAPIFKVADYGIVGDLFQVAPALTAEFRKLRS